MRSFQSFIDAHKGKVKRYQKLYAFLWGMPLYRKVMSCVNNRLKHHIDREGLSSIGTAVRTVDMFLSLWVYGCSYSEYNLYGFSKLKHRERREFIGDCCRKKYYMRFNSIAEIDCFRNKNRTYQEFARFYNRQASAFCVADGFDRFCEIINRYGNAMIKPATASGGYGVVKVSASVTEDVRKCFDQLSIIAPNEEAIIEEYVQQAPELKALHPASLNTARIITILDHRGEPHIIGSIFRIGRDGKNVDNGSSGGILCDLSKSGVILKCTDKTGQSYIDHPNTGHRLIGFVIPRWDEAITLVMELARQKPAIRYCGWDIALTTKGWIMIEGNESAEFSVMQAFGYGYRTTVTRYL